MTTAFQSMLLLMIGPQQQPIWLLKARSGSLYGQILELSVFTSVKEPLQGFFWQSLTVKDVMQPRVETLQMTLDEAA